MKIILIKLNYILAKYMFLLCVIHHLGHNRLTLLPYVSTPPNKKITIFYRDFLKAGTTQKKYKDNNTNSYLKKQQRNNE